MLDVTKVLGLLGEVRPTIEGLLRGLVSEAKSAGSVSPETAQSVHDGVMAELTKLHQLTQSEQSTHHSARTGKGV